MDEQSVLQNFRNNFAHYDPTTMPVPPSPATTDPTNAAVGTSNGDGAFNELAWITARAAANSDVKPAGFNCQSAPGTAPTQPFGNARVAGVEAGTGFAEPTADYIGAIEDSSDNWMTGVWVDWSLGD